MGRRAKVRMLPEALREELNARLAASQFSDYEGLSKWLAEKGFKIARSSLQRYGSKFEQKLDQISQAVHQAREVVAAMPDQEGAMGDALVRLVEQKIFEVLVDCEGAIDQGDLSKIARAVADLGRTTISQKRWRVEVGERLQSQKADAAKQISEVERKGGLSPEAAETIRDILLGIDPLNSRTPFDGRAAESAR